jgi:NAD(P)-dependent dehydrogenase (short-subunit alcohol dehydrogenase family)
VADSEALAGTYAEVTAAMGAPDMVIHNAVRGTRGDYLAVDPADLERNFQINVMALLHLARLAVPAMVARGGGVVLATGNTAAYRGKAHFAAFAPTKAAQRILIETIARKSGPDGIHAALIAIDAVIDVPWTREAFADKSDDFFSKPGDIAEVCWQVAHQPRSAWCSEVMIRPFGETW